MIKNWIINPALIYSVIVLQTGTEFAPKSTEEDLLSNDTTRELLEKEINTGTDMDRDIEFSNGIIIKALKQKPLIQESEYRSPRWILSYWNHSLENNFFSVEFELLLREVIHKKKWKYVFCLKFFRPTPLPPKV